MGFYYFYEEYFSVNLKDYPNIGIDLEISKLLFYFCIGVMIAAIVLNYKRACTVSLIKKRSLCLKIFFFNLLHILTCLFTEFI